MFTQKTYTWMFIIALFVMAQDWEQARCPSKGTWLKKPWCISTMESCSAINRKEYWCNNLDESQGYILYSSTYRTFLKWQNYRNGDQINGCQQLGMGGEREMVVAVKGQQEGSFGEGTVLCLDCACVCWSLSRVRLLVTPWTVARQAPLSMEFSRQEYWSG